MLSVGQLLRAVHVKRQWFEEETIVKLDRRKLCVTRKISLLERLSLGSMAIYQSRGLLVCINARQCSFIQMLNLYCKEKVLRRVMPKPYLDYLR